MRVDITNQYSVGVKHTETVAEVVAEARAEAAAEEEDEEAVEKAAEAAVQDMKAAEFAVALLIPSPLVFSDLLPFESFPSLFPQIFQGLLSHSFAAPLPVSTLSFEGATYFVITPYVSTHFPVVTQV